MKARMARTGVALVAAAAAVVATGSAAQAEAGFSAEKYEQVQFGMTFDEVWEISGGGSMCHTGGSLGDSILCYTESGDYAPYGGFSFTDEGELWNKRNEYLYKAKTPSVKLSHYNRTALGMTEAQLWAAVPKDLASPRARATRTGPRRPASRRSTTVRPPPASSRRPPVSTSPTAS